MMQETKSAEIPAATSPADEVLAAAHSLIGEATFLRCLCEDAKQRYDEDGHSILAIQKPTDWTLAAINIEKVARKDASHIELSGPRMGIRYNEYGKIFERKPLKLAEIHIEVAADSDAQFKRALDNIFAIGIDYRLQQATTPLWKHYFNAALPWPDDDLKGKTIYRTAPKATSFVEASATAKSDILFTTEAQQNRITGSILVKAIIDVDGKAKRVLLVQPLGFGLDQPTAASIAKWTFKPATKDGQPVISEITIEERIAARPSRPVR